MREVSSSKISSLRDIVLEKANSEKETLLSESHRETEEWLTRETEKLQKEVDHIIQEAHKNADVIRRRHIMSAEREKATDILRTQNRVFSDALNKLQDKLVQLRDSKSYVDILTGMCVEAIESLKDVDSLTLRLATVDAGFADQIIEKTKKIIPNVTLTFDREPAPILGGCRISTADNSRQVNLDWQNIAQEMADTLAEQLLPLL